MVHPWQEIDLDIYETHMNDPKVGQLQMLHSITATQLRDNSAHTVAILGIAGGNGLNLIDPSMTDRIDGYDINATYLEACRRRYGTRFGDRLRLIEASIDRSLRLDPVDLVIANLIIEYVGLEEFVEFLSENSTSIGVVSCLTQQNGPSGTVSATPHSASFLGLEQIASEIDPLQLEGVLAAAGWIEVVTSSHPLPNRKLLTRQDFTPPTPAHAAG